ncbi:non-ribosomal peptide synthetase [Methylocapsa aurea]|uniref:non-ribosomal peptide synthetase n=1 Tax=Methylocapsa aurea TaxID=663610 RepID=UPI00068A3AC0|nr:non-ribosomal peptide synthetase [Methylocapsa aurea]
MSRRFGQDDLTSGAPASDPRATIHGSLLDIVSKDPEASARPAIVCGARIVSYADLDLQSNQIARYLRGKGIGAGDLVGLFLHRSPEAILAMLGILKAGAAFLPLDPSYPANHLAFIAEDARPAAVVSAAEMFSSPGQSRPWAAPTILLDAESDAIGRESAAPLDAFVGPNDLAYVMYTSGTTGRPKGVMVPHRGVVRLAWNNFVDLGPSDVVLQLAPLAFDASTFEIWAALLNGASIAVVASAHPSFSEIGEAIARHKVTTAWLTASLFHAIVDHHLEILRPLRQLIAGGDILSPRHVRKLLDALPDCLLVNGYGPTENTTFTCCYAIPRDAPADAPVPIGPPILHTRVHVLDDQLRPTALGELGELFAAGEGVALGYLNRPELTTEKFLPDTFSGKPGCLMYRTGDVVRQRADGVVEFVGRVDRQVKINGKRIELDEVEATVRRLPEVADAAAIVRARADGERQIVAYVAAHAGAKPDPAALRRRLLELAPDYMAPAQIIILDALPLKPNGKIDRDALPVPPAWSGAEAQAEAPAEPLADRQAERAVPLAQAASDIEAELASIWRKILKVSYVGLDANFFDLGGSSLDLMALHEEIRARFQDEVPMTSLFEHTTIRALAARLHNPDRGAAPVSNFQDRKLRQNEALRKIWQRRASTAR